MHILIGQNLWLVVPVNACFLVNSLLLLTNNYFIKAIDGIFYGFPGIINPHGVLGEHSKTLQITNV